VKKLMTIILCVFFLAPCCAFSMTLMTDAELASITGRIGSPAHLEATMDEAAFSESGPVDGRNAQGGVQDPSLNANDGAGSHVYARGQGISIYIVDVLFDVYIGNIAYGDRDSCMQRFSE